MNPEKDDLLAQIILEPFNPEKEFPPMKMVEDWKNQTLREIGDRGYIAENPQEITDNVTEMYEHLRQGYAVKVAVYLSDLNSVRLELSYTNDSDELLAIEGAKGGGDASEDYLRAIHQGRVLTWPDGAFVSSCTKCGKCCSSISGVFLRPLDVLRACKEMNLGARELIEKYCTLDLKATGTGFAVLTFRKGEDEKCILFDSEKMECQLPLLARPAMCRLYPIARQYQRNRDDILKEAISRVTAHEEDPDWSQGLLLMVDMRSEKCKYYFDSGCPSVRAARADEEGAITIKEYIDSLLPPKETTIDDLFFSLVLALDLIFDRDDALQVAPFLSHVLYNLDEPIFPLPEVESEIDIDDGINRRIAASYLLSKMVFSGIITERGDMDKVRLVSSLVIGQMLSIWQLFTYGVDLWGNMDEDQARNALEYITELLNDCANELGDTSVPQIGGESDVTS